MYRNEIIKLFSQLGLNSSLKGYRYMVHIINLALSKYANSFFLIKDLYDETAKFYNVSPDSIQRSIRTLLNTYWTSQNTKHFYDIIGYPVFHSLPPKEFIAVIVDYLSMKQF